MSVSDPLPLYSPSGAAPSYAPEPSRDEQRLDFVARSRQREAPECSFTKRVGGVTVVLPEQERNASTPSYARHGVVKGEVLLEDENILSVSIKLEGRQYMAVAEGGTSTQILFSESCSLWKRVAKTTSHCPGVLPFRIPFPLTYEDGEGSRRPLPPSFVASYPGTPGLTARCVYYLTIDVTKPRLGSWKHHSKFTIPIRYHPRSRPYLPIGSDLNPFFATVKSAPGDWHQVTTTMNTRENSSMQPIECHLYIPSVQIYAISDTIPFHLQLRGPVSSLQAFLYTPPPPTKTRRARRPKSHSQPSIPHHPFPLSVPFPFSLARSSSCSEIPEPPPGLPQSLAEGQSAKPLVRVYLLRQICANVNGQKAWRNCILGEGKISPVQPEPPDLYTNFNTEEALDWEGEVRCNQDVCVGGFQAGALVVKDFIVLELKPHLPRCSSLLELQHAHPIRLVTDTYIDL